MWPNGARRLPHRRRHPRQRPLPQPAPHPHRQPAPGATPPALRRPRAVSTPDMGASARSASRPHPRLQRKPRHPLPRSTVTSRPGYHLLATHPKGQGTTTSFRCAATTRPRGNSSCCTPRTSPSTTRSTRRSARSSRSMPAATRRSPRRRAARYAFDVQEAYLKYKPSGLLDYGR